MPTWFMTRGLRLAPQRALGGPLSSRDLYAANIGRSFDWRSKPRLTPPSLPRPEAVVSVACAAGPSHSVSGNAPVRPNEHDLMRLVSSGYLERLGFESRREQRELLVSRSHCLAQPGDLGGHEVTRDPPVDDHHRGNEEARRHDGNAVGHSYTVEFSPCGHLRRTVAAVTGSNNGIAGARLAARLRSRTLRGTS